MEWMKIKIELFPFAYGIFNLSATEMDDDLMFFFDYFHQ